MENATLKQRRGLTDPNRRGLTDPNRDVQLTDKWENDAALCTTKVFIRFSLKVFLIQLRKVGQDLQTALSLKVDHDSPYLGANTNSGDHLLLLGLVNALVRV